MQPEGARARRAESRLGGEQWKRRPRAKHRRPRALVASSKPGGVDPKVSPRSYPFSYPDPERAPQRTGFDPRGHPASHEAPIAGSARPRASAAAASARPAKPSQHAPTAPEGDAQPCALDDVTSIHDRGLEHAAARSERVELEAMHDPAGNPDEDDDSDPHADCDSRRQSGVASSARRAPDGHRGSHRRAHETRR